MPADPNHAQSLTAKAVPSRNLENSQLDTRYWNDAPADRDGFAIQHK
jgi:hypothetical protein